MKRSSQVLLVLMGVTSTTAVGHYLAQPRTECVQQAPTAKSGTPQEVTQPCTTTSRGGGGGSHTGWRSSSSETGGASSSEHGKVGTSAPLSGSGAERGGFGSTGHGISSSG